MSFRSKKPKAELDVERGCGFYDEMDMDVYLAIVEPMAGKLEAIKGALHDFDTQPMVGWRPVVNKIRKILEAS